MPSANELIAYGRNDEEVAAAIGADGLIYQDLEDLKRAVQRNNDKLRQFDTSVFDGCYVTGDISEGYLEQLELVRCDDQVQRKNQAFENDLLGLHR